MLDRSAFEQLSQEQLIDLVLSLQQRVAALEAKLEDKSGPGEPPPFVRANVRRKQEKQARKKRSQAFVRPRETPTQVCLHVPPGYGGSATTGRLPVPRLWPRPVRRQ